jgi:hypothetical protein
MLGNGGLEHMNTRIGPTAAALTALALYAGAAQAAVVCQKGTKLTLRPDACKSNETQVGSLAGGDPSGIWAFDSGTIFDASGLEPLFLVLDADGTGRLNASGGDGGVITCASLAYSLGVNSTLVLDLPSFSEISATRVHPYTLGASTLELRDAAGRTGSFTRADAVDPAAECGTLTQAALFTGLPEPSFFSGLAYDGANLRYEEDNTGNVFPVDPATGAAGTPILLDNTQFTHVHAVQDGDFWTHCGCGGSEEAGRVTALDSLVDEVETESELGDEIGVRAIAYDATGGVLWLHGSNDAGQGRLLKVDASGEPDVLLTAFDLDAFLSGLAFDGTSLWGVNFFGQSLVRIDPATGTATGNFRIPNTSATWSGVAVVDSELALLGATGTEGVILKVARP